MLHATTLTTDQVSDRISARRGGKRMKVSTSQRASGDALNEIIMGKANVSIDYLRNLQATTDRMAEDMARRMLEAGGNGGVSVVYESGRVLDKILVGTLNADKSMSAPAVRFFVERETGIIYGIKSDKAPNKRHYFGTIYTSGLWDWSGDFPQPKDARRAGVEQVGSYGGYAHFRAVEQPA